MLMEHIFSRSKYVVRYPPAPACQGPPGCEEWLAIYIIAVLPIWQSAVQPSGILCGCCSGILVTGISQLELLELGPMNK